MYRAGFLALFLIVLVAGINNWAEEKIEGRQEASPFLHVTNRELSLFLWQFPHFMRVHAKNKIGYLPGFQYLHRINIEPGFAEKGCIAPPSILFFYHTWKRLLSSYVPKRKIELLEFQEFLSCLEEWREIADRLDIKNLPQEVIQAFFGWKNYYKEGDKINAFRPTFFQLKNFLDEHPHYARSYWQHILKKSVPNYLKTFEMGSFHLDALVPQEELAPHLRVALYNHVNF